MLTIYVNSIVPPTKSGQYLLFVYIEDELGNFYLASRRCDH